ncbi:MULTISPECIES: DMT family transporter [Cysteiniphilum]|uniref:DMT family transporter n=1 Tax=Cysteiniphilum TaxID=2056696 RepID=UPI00193C5980|nr:MULTISPECIES: DMT family transporter [Cysteiniphilum]
MYYIYYFSAAFLLGLYPLFNRLGLESGMNSYGVSFGRIFFATILATLFSLPHFKDYFRLRIKDIFFILSFAITTLLTVLSTPFGLMYGTAAEAGITIALTPIFGMLYSVLFLKEKITKLDILAIIASVGGLIIMSLKGASNVGPEHPWIGILIFMIFPITAGYGLSVQTKIARKDISRIVLLTLAFWLDLIIIIVIGMLYQINSKTMFLQHFQNGFWWVFGLGFASFFSYWLFMIAAKKISGVLMGVASAVGGVIAVILSIFLLHDELTTQTILGFVLIIISVSMLFINESSKKGR